MTARKDEREREANRPLIIVENALKLIFAITFSLFALIFADAGGWPSVLAATAGAAAGWTFSSWFSSLGRSKH